MDKLNIRGVDILAVPNQQAMIHYLFSANTLKTGCLVAINAEKMILCDEQPAIGEIIEQADYNYADGISIVRSIQKKYPAYRHLQRIAGADLWLALMQKAGELGIPVFLLGATEETLNKTAEKLAKWNVKIVGKQHGYFSPSEEREIISCIQQSGAKLVSVALGSPKQECFMHNARQIYPNTLYMGVGGSYDVFIGKVKRAPLVWQKWGMEWLYRLLCQPTRWQRQLRLFKYTYYYLMKKL